MNNYPDNKSQTNSVLSAGVSGNQPGDGKKFSSSSEEESLRDAVNLAQKGFSLVSGLGKFESRLCACYDLATWFIEQINPFPLLTITGSGGTGKTSILCAFNGMAFNPVMFAMSKITEPVLRDKLHDADHGTAIIDEADESLCDLEGFLTNRYLRETASSAKKIPVGGHQWLTENIPIFGATVLHKRQPYKDPAVESRSITVNTTADTDRKYLKPKKVEPLYSRVRELAETARATVAIGSEPTIPEGCEVAGRVVDTYRPILLIAEKIAATDFLTELWGRIQAASLDLREGQTYEPGPLLLQALIAHLEAGGKLKLRSVRIEGELLKWVRDVHGKVINAWQAAKILRGYGLTIKRIGGPNHVAVDNIKALAQICRAVGIHDEVLEQEVERPN